MYFALTDKEIRGMSIIESTLGKDGEILYDRNYQMLLLANFIPPLGAGLLSPILGSLIGAFGTTPANIGLMISIFTAPSIIINPIVGIVADRHGRKPVLVFSLALFGLAGVAIAFTTEFRTALGLRLLQGIGFSGMFPIIITSIGDFYDGTAEATGQGIRFAGAGASNMVFPFLSGVLVMVAWQYPFIMYVLALPVALAVLAWFEEPADDVEENRGDMADDLKSQLFALFDLLKHRRVIMMIIARGLPVMVWIGFITFNSIIVTQSLNSTPTWAGILVTISSLGWTVAASQTGRLTRFFASRLYLLIFANICLSVGFVLFLFAPGILTASFGIAVTGVGFGFTLSLYRSIITGLTMDSLRSSLVSLAEAFGRLAATLTPILMGKMIEYLSSSMDTVLAIQISGFGVAIVSGIGGIICLIIADQSARTYWENDNTF